MTAFTITLQDEQAEALMVRANELQIAPEELLRTQIAEWLEQPSSESDFTTAATYVLHKNAELYRRLAVPASSGSE